MTKIEIIEKNLEKLRGLLYLTDELLADDSALAQIIRQTILNDKLDVIKIKLS